ncbi:hypothetical protein QBC32DRAFT_363988 [Pseudoneurospora amorphoporcata]|uniref:Uncharacterized protein n=1 Tax=Pseudoneurospora amorphoporcata TaxID=241081 RepID=A0AAN6SDP3_9PEZI|nr:hypothetical protein QBC32DRAFT_363988 [Pseudoneurospora amorphoporcata]
MPKRPRAMASTADLATGEPNEDRRKRLSPELSTASDEPEVVNMEKETAGGDMDQDEEDDDEHDDDKDVDDEDESEKDEINPPDNGYIPSPWSVGDASTPKDPFVEDSPQVDLISAFHNERGNHDSPHQATVPLPRYPAILSLRSESDYENYHKRPRINFGRPEWRAYYSLPPRP